MRLLTFQNKDCLKVLEEGSWYSTKDNRMKLVDYDYADEDKGVYPIYTFASFGTPYKPCFSLAQFYGQLCHLAGFMRFNLGKTILVELEVPEDFILSLKKNNEWFEQRCEDADPDRETLRCGYKGRRYWVKRDLSAGTIYTSNYLEAVRNNRGEEFEALIPYLKKEHVAAIREFHPEGSSYENTLCKTIYTNEALHPLWYGDIIMNGDGYPRFNKQNDADIIKEISDIKASGYTPFSEYVAQDKYGAKSVPLYFTIEETLSCANKELSHSIRENIESLNIDKKLWDKMTLEELAHSVGKNQDAKEMQLFSK